MFESFGSWCSIFLRFWDIKGLIDAISANGLLFPGKLSVDVGPEGVTADIDESNSDRDPPPLEGGTILP